MSFIHELETPAVLVDLDLLDRNLRQTAQLAVQTGVKLRPHIKTHKSVWIAKRQIEYGACGITAAKLGEAEVMAEAGIGDILIAYPIVGRRKLERLRRLMERASVTVSTDDAAVAKGLSDLGEAIRRPIPLYVDVNTGLNRMGREPGAPTAELVKRIAALPGVEVVGLMTHGGHAYSAANLDEARCIARQEAEGLTETKRLLEAEGIPIREISVGSTPTSKFIGEQHGVTEMRPGAYVFGDRSQLASQVISEADCAMTVLATVVSTPRPGTIVIDAGSKTFSSDANVLWPGFGTLLGRPDVCIARLSEEHGIVSVPEDATFAVGDMLRFVPNHCCTTANLHDRLIGIRGDKAEREIQVDARGKIT